MKKTYCKPMVAFESFQMTSNIAGTCVVMGNSGNENSCTYFDSVSGWTFFTNGGCNMNLTEMFCYHIPTDDTSIFAS